MQDREISVTRLSPNMIKVSPVACGQDFLSCQQVKWNRPRAGEDVRLTGATWWLEYFRAGAKDFLVLHSSARVPVSSSSQPPSSPPLYLLPLFFHLCFNLLFSSLSSFLFSFPLFKHFLFLFLSGPCRAACLILTFRGPWHLTCYNRDSAAPCFLLCITAPVWRTPSDLPQQCCAT